EHEKKYHLKLNSKIDFCSCVKDILIKHTKKLFYIYFF
ncbi:hypothetical protein M5D96_008456, partial [Drosophila gunungcola]